MTDDVKLELCPFCGGEAELEDLGDPQDDSFVHCANPRCEVQQIAQYTPEQAIAAWNTRTSTSVSAEAEVERLRSLSKANNDLARMNADDRDAWRAEAIARIEALEPFALIADTIDEVGRDDSDDDRILVAQTHGCALAELTEDDFRRARAALSLLEKK